MYSIALPNANEGRWFLAFATVFTGPFIVLLKVKYKQETNNRNNGKARSRAVHIASYVPLGSIPLRSRILPYLGASADRSYWYFYVLSISRRLSGLSRSFRCPINSQMGTSDLVPRLFLAWSWYVVLAVFMFNWITEAKLISFHGLLVIGRAVTGPRTFAVPSVQDVQSRDIAFLVPDTRI